jgi:integrase
MNAKPYQNRNGRWAINFTDGTGTRRRAYLGFMSPGEAETAAALLMAQVQAGTWTPPRQRKRETRSGGENVAGLVRVFLADRERHVTPETLEAYTSYLSLLTQLVPPLTRLSDVDRPLLRDARDRLFDLPNPRGQRRSRQSINTVLSVWRSLFLLGERNEVRGLAPGLGVALPAFKAGGSRGGGETYRPIAEDQFFSPNEVGAILKAAEEESLQDRTLLLLAFATGARRGELAGLKWRAVDLDSRRVTFSRTCRADRVKSGVPRAVRITPAAAAALRALKAQVMSATVIPIDAPSIVDTLPVFPLRNGEHSSDGDFSRLLRRCCDRAKVRKPRIHCHMTRHSCASNLLASGRSIKEVAEVLGHKTTLLTDRCYAHVAASDLDAAMDRSETFLIGF